MILASGCASVPGPPDERDPFESFNRSMYKFNDVADRAVIRPVATVYRDYLPDLIQDGIRNFFSNLNDIVVMVNSLLQFKVEQAVVTSYRIVFNTTWGLLGFVEITSIMDLPKQNEDFGQTLAVWGFYDGPYLVIPLLGPSTVRDTVGLAGDIYVNPLTHGILQEDFQQWGAVVVAYISLRADLLGTTRVVDQAAIDPYIFSRDAFFQYRRNLIYDGNPPPPDDQDFSLDSDSDLEMDLQLQLELEKNQLKKEQANPPSSDPVTQ